MSRLRSPFIAFTCCALVTLAGCASDGDPTSAESPTTTIVVPGESPSTTIAPAATSTVVPVAGDLGVAPSTTAVAPTEPSNDTKFPLDATFGLGFDTQPDPLAQSEIERLTAECMLAEGWKYTPTVTRAADDPVEFSGAYGEMYGYGIVHSYQEMGAIEQAPADANEEYVASLTESERQQYYLALTGDQSAGYDPTKGCANTAATAVNGLSPLQKSDEFARRVESWLQTLDQNPALSAAAATRGTCLLQRFPTIDRYSAPFEYVQELFNTALDGAGGGRIPADQLAVLATTEVEVWRAERDCAESSGYNDARRQLEAEFVTELLVDFPELALQPN